MIPNEATATFERSDRGLTVSITGELDVSASTLSDQISSEVQCGRGTLWLELSQVTFCGSTGVALIAKAEREAVDRGDRLILLNPSRAVMRTLELCNLAHRYRVRIG